MLFNRQKKLLTLLDVLGGKLGKIDFQKLLFLYCLEWDSKEPPYDFIPYKYGGFSFTSYADKRKLTEIGLLEEDDRIWKLTKAGKGRVKEFHSSSNRYSSFAEAYENIRGDELVKEAYRKFPYHAINSEIADELLKSDQMALMAIQSERPAVQKPGLYTIGYEGKSLEAYLNLLIKSSVSLLCDVRRNPLSRKYGFSKGTLKSGCEGVGIRYEHLPELGIESTLRKGLNGQSDYDALFLKYERDTLPNQGHSLAAIRSWVEEGYRVALTCLEHSPEQCHRHCVAEALVKEYGTKLAANHL